MININQLAAKIKQLETEMLPVIASEVVNFSYERIEQENWLNTSPQPWPKRKPARWGRKQREGRGLLIDTGTGRRSLRTIVAGNSIVLQGIDYMGTHNEGFEGTVQQNVSQHTRRLYARQGRARVSRGSTTVRSHSRTIHQRIPRRQFAGDSAELRRRIALLYINRIKSF